MSEASTTMSNDRELIAENTRRKEAQRRLKSEVDTLKAQLAERDAKIEALTADYGELAEALESLDPEAMEAETKELTELRAWREQVGNDPQYQRLSEEINALKGTIRDGKHQSAFDKKAKDMGFNPDALKDIWEQSKYKPDSDDVDESAIEAVLKPLYEAKPWLRKPVETASTDPSNGTNAAQTASSATAQDAAGQSGKTAPAGAKPLTVQPTQAGVGVGRGSPDVPGKPLVTVADKINAKWHESGRGSDAFKL